MFDKYARWGAYHFKWYGHGASRKEKYVRHVDRIRDWIKEKNVLDVGAGEGVITHVLGIKGIELNPIAVKLGQKRGIDVIQGDVYNLPYSDGEFDAIFMGDVLEHLEFPDKALLEARRVLKEKLYLAVPQKEDWKDPLDQYYDWTAEELKEFVEEQGFKLEGEIELYEKKMYAKFSKNGVPKLIDYIDTMGTPVETPNFTREDLPQFFIDMGYKTGAEIGVYKGEFTSSFARVGLNIYGIDPWLEYYGAGRLSQNHHNARYEDAKQNTGAYPNCTLIRKNSSDALKDFKDGSLDFVYIDGDHTFAHVAHDIYEWNKKVRVGGVVSGHDYFNTRPSASNVLCHVGVIVDAYTRLYKIPQWFVIGRFGLVEGEKRDKTLSWMWIKR